MMSADAEAGPRDLDHIIRERYNAGMDPEDIATGIGKSREFVARRLRSMNKRGEVERRPSGVWSHSVCTIGLLDRTCGMKRPDVRRSKCRDCPDRHRPSREGLR